MTEHKTPPIRILLAEDNPADYEKIVDALKTTSLVCETVWVKNGEEASDFLLNRKSFASSASFSKPDLVLLDLNMPGKSGLQVFEEMANHVQLKRIPVIFITSMADEGAVAQLLKAGAADYLNKLRLSADVLERSIRYAMRLRRNDETRIVAEQVSARLGRVLDYSSSEIYIFSADTHRIMHANQGMRRHLGFSDEELKTMRPLDFMPQLSEEAFTSLITSLITGEKSEVQFETVHRRKNGSLYPVEISLQLSRLEQPPVFFAVAQDVSEKMKAEEIIERMSNYDVLTELPNRMLFRSRLMQALAEAGTSKQVPIVFCVDIDRFRSVVETLGMAVGDHALKAVADRLRRALREGDMVARVEGDEFMLLIPGRGEPDDASKVAQRILAALSRPFHVDGHELHFTASVGVSIYPAGGTDADTLIKNSATALHHAKEIARNHFQIYDASMNAKALGQLVIENNLRRALKEDELMLYYQTQVDVKTGNVVGAEALIRWKHPEIGLVYPTEFIRVAEESGLIVPMGEWVLRSACRQCKSWNDNGGWTQPVAVNISLHQIYNKNFLPFVESVLRETCLDPTQLILEVTETVFMDPRRSAQEALAALKKLNVQIALDDFGTGFSSLGYLKSFHIDILKIDKSFIQSMIKDSDYVSIVQSMIDLAHRLKICVVAEGVETREQWELLRTSGCERAQGYFFSKPVPPETFSRLLEANKKVRSQTNLPKASS